jgi:citrate lyase subunit beta/citryl-CoA lyase
MTLLWRSLQYVPTHVEKYVASPRIHEADAIILDLEDSVPAGEKAGARERLPAAIEVVGGSGADVLVRINAGPDLLAADVEAAVRPGVRALVAPKVRSAAQVRDLSDLIAATEARNGVAVGATRLLLLIETAEGFLDMAAIAAAGPRVAALNLGAEDFALDVGLEPDEETLAMPRQQTVIAAAAAGVLPLGLMGQGTRYDDLEAYGALARRSRRFGFKGASCIHPSQIAILNDAFSPPAEACAWAGRVLAAASEAARDGRAAFSLDGRMIDPPIVARAAEIEQLSRLIQNKKRRNGPT